MDNIDVTKLFGEELDYWVAKVSGLNVVGKALCYPDYDCGGLDISLEQNHGEEHYVYVRSCSCDTINEMQAKYERGEAEAEFWIPFNSKLYGHYTTCLAPILDYSSDWYIGGHLITNFDIGIYRIHYMSNWGPTWGATAPDFPVSYSEPYVIGSSPLEAAMRSLVKWKLEHPVEP